MSAAKMIAVLARCERAMQRNEALTVRIKASLIRCRTVKAFSGATFLEKNAGGFFDGEGRIKTHLWEAYSEYDADEVSQEEHLRDPDDGCRHCYSAWRLVRLRKKARQELGAARRLVRHYGKEAIKAEKAAP